MSPRALRSRTTLLLATTAILLSGCASWFHHPKFAAKIRPIEAVTTSDDAAKLSRIYYGRAVKAIGSRDYATALEQLQAAKMRDPQDIAVLNALGVVYDKLGRFDLSARYYTQAAAIDPSSPIVQRNLAYSAELQNARNTSSQPAMLAGGPPPAAVMASAPVLPPAASPSPAYSGFTLAQAPAAPKAMITTVAPNGALLAGRPLQLVDATGRAEGAEAVRLGLAAKGWTAPKSQVRTGPVEAVSTIRYPQGGEAIAASLARTLSFPVRLAVCTQECDRVVLTIGKDSPTSKARS